MKTLCDGLLKHDKCTFSYSLYSSKFDKKVEYASNHLVASFPTEIHNPLLHIIFSNWIQFSFTVFKRKSFDSVGGFSRVISISSIGAFDKNRLMAPDSYSWARLSTVGPAFCVDERLGFKRYHSESFGALNRTHHLEEVVLFNQRVFSDFEIFDDVTRYFSLLVIISRLTQKRNLLDCIEDLFEKSLFSLEEFSSDNFQSIKPSLVKATIRVLDSFYYDFEKFNFRKLLNDVDRKKYLSSIS